MASHEYRLSTQVTKYLSGEDGRYPYIRLVDYTECNKSDEGAISLEHTGNEYYWLPVNPLTDDEKRREITEGQYLEAIYETEREAEAARSNAVDELKATGLSDRTIQMLLDRT